MLLVINIEKQTLKLFIMIFFLLRLDTWFDFDIK